MCLKYGVTIDDIVINKRLRYLTNQIYKLLPIREEEHDWELPLQTIIEEFSGMSRLFVGQQELILTLLCKLEGLFFLTKQEDFFLYRRTIFECLRIVEELMRQCQDMTI